MSEPLEVATITFDNSDGLRDIGLDMVRNCRRNLDIASRHLDPILFDNAEFTDALKHIVLNNRRARIRLLIMDSAPLISHGHRLIELASRLSSFITIRKPGQDHQNFNEAMMIADNSAYIHRRFADRYDGLASHDDRRTASDLSNRFDELWERSEIDPNFRRLHI